MATKKQRRRREKERRHDYEFVYVDEEGQEVEVDEPEEPKARAKPETSGIKPTPGAKRQTTAAKPKSRSDRVVEPPSWDRTFRRAAIFVPIMLIFLYLTKPKNYSTAGIVLQALFIIVVLVLFMYGMDHFLYRSYLKRTGKRDGGSTPKTK
jgi:hypothetical protein